ncbi:hypothetical protein PPERSA_06976 [Pseudocohnilembus persalinus]|uniref:Uncharacterized protein n=1 Tax=Pseudocohnilembus persalinus TaxID=266149 RepID=A0A0V0QYU8_PSEPJ|nr:hypothetical protein PPERSA_06976 [Pseudocohnilembus persalinus]|eukprot:KRX07361.1 hypothetical protein PPERSA_06976 [Pseudocohnilembus persalinus]
MHKHKNDRIIKINDAFDYHLVKPKFLSLRQKLADKYVNLMNKNIENNVDLKFDKKNQIYFGKKDDVDKSFKILQGGDYTDDYVFQENKITKLWATLKYDFWDFYIKHPQNTQNCKEKLQQIFSQQTIDNMKQSINQFRKDFADYKINYSDIPSKQDIKNMTLYREINQEKVYTNKHLIRDYIEMAYESFNYIAFGSTKKAEFPLQFFYFGEFDKEKRPKYKMESYIPQLFLFTAICIIPSKIIFKSKGLFTHMRDTQKKAKLMRKHL